MTEDPKAIVTTVDHDATPVGSANRCSPSVFDPVEVIGLYRAAGYTEVPAFNSEPYAHHWFEKSVKA